MRVRSTRVLAALAVAGTAIALSTGAAGAAPSGSGSGLSLNVTGPVAVNVPPIPLVTLPPGGSTTVAGVNVPGVLGAGVLNASSQQTATGAASSASVANLAALPAVAPISASAVSSSCTSDASGTSGTSSIVNGSVLGFPVAVSPSPNSSVSVPLVGTVILNEQQTSGSQITVRAIHAIIATPLGVGADLPVATSVCDSGLASPGSGSGGSGSGSGGGAHTVAVNPASAASATNANPTLAG